MDVYQLDYVLHEPAEEHGCMYWVDTPEQTFSGLWGNARILIEMFREDERPLFAALAAAKEGTREQASSPRVSSLE